MAWIAETGTGASAQAFTSFIVSGSELALNSHLKDGAGQKNEYD
jgi:hypothetical protein